MPILYPNNKPPNFIKLDNVASIFTTNHAFSVLYKNGIVDTIGDSSGGTILNTDKVNVLPNLTQISTISNTNKAFTAIRFFYSINIDHIYHDYWLQPINLNYNGEIVKHDNIQFIHRLINEPEAINMNDILISESQYTKTLDEILEGASSENLMYYRSNMFTTILEQNKDIDYFILETNSHLNINEIENNQRFFSICIYSPNKVIEHNVLTKIFESNDAIYIPMNHYNDQLELQLIDKENHINYLFRNHIEDGPILYIQHHKKSEYLKVKLVEYDDKYTILNYKIVSTKGFYGVLLININSPDSKEDMNETFVRNYGHLIRHRPLRYDI